VAAAMTAPHRRHQVVTKTEEKLAFSQGSCAFVGFKSVPKRKKLKRIFEMLNV
jgi:hypothetical protein